jgi:hypothetical protein
MKNKEAFEKWFDRLLDKFTKTKKYLPKEAIIALINMVKENKYEYKIGWEGCEEYYESRKCENCKRKS